MRLILDNFGIVGFLVFGRMPVDSSHFSPHIDSILSPKYFILKDLKRSFDPNVRTNWRPTGERSRAKYRPVSDGVLHLCRT
jgi:hypothetical protein